MRSVPRFLLDMPASVLFGSWSVMGPWLQERGLQSPTLLDVGNARWLRKSRKPRPKGERRGRRGADA